MIVFKTTAGDPIVNFATQFLKNQTEIIPVLVPCIANRSLRATAVAHATVEGRVQGDVAWVNLETGSIDTTPYAPLDQAFEIRVSFDSSLGRRTFDLEVT